MENNCRFAFSWEGEAPAEPCKGSPGGSPSRKKRDLNHPGSRASGSISTGRQAARACRGITYRGGKIRGCVFYVPCRGRIRLRGPALVPIFVDSFANRGTSASVNPARRNGFSNRAGSCEDDRRPVCTNQIFPSAVPTRFAN